MRDSDSSLRMNLVSIHRDSNSQDSIAARVLSYFAFFFAALRLCVNRSRCRGISRQDAKTPRCAKSKIRDLRRGWFPYHRESVIISDIDYPLDSAPLRSAFASHSEIIEDL